MCDPYQPLGELFQTPKAPDRFRERIQSCLCLVHKSVVQGFDARDKLVYGSHRSPLFRSLLFGIGLAPSFLVRQSL